MDIKGKVFIVTGGASGLGEGTAEKREKKEGEAEVSTQQKEQGFLIRFEGDFHDLTDKLKLILNLQQ